MGNKTEPIALERVLTVIKEVLNVSDDEARPECDIREDLVADSLDMISLVWALEEEFGGKIDDDALESLQTPTDVASYIESRESRLPLTSARD